MWDEADRLLDLGFAGALDRIMECIRLDKQMLMFSATWPDSVRIHASKHMVNDENNTNVVRVSIGTMSEMTVNEDITQKFVFFENDQEKDVHLFNFLKEHPEDKMLIFCDRKDRCIKWVKYCNEHDLPSVAICGGKIQNAREKALGKFRGWRMNIMFATDVAGRGLQIEDIDIVINYYMPRDKCEDYIHRIGRTARAGNVGMAISYFVPEYDSWCAEQLVSVLKKSNQPVPEQLIGIPNTNKRRSKGKVDCAPKLR